MSKITVVTYCHEKHKKWIPFWLEQIQKQSTQDFKILFVMHNWPDEDVEFYTYQMECVLGDRLDLHQHNGPPIIGDVIDYAARNIKTEFMAHWDVDDWIHPDRLKLQIAYLDTHPEVDFLGTRMVGFTGDPKPEMMQTNYYEPNEPNAEATEHDQIYNCLLRKGQNCLGHTTMVYRPEILAKLGGFSRSDVKLDGRSPDFETWKKALMAGYKFHRLPELCALWRLDSSSIRL